MRCGRWLIENSPKFPGRISQELWQRSGREFDDFCVGDRVFGMTSPFKGGAFAEFAAVPASHLARLPDGVSFEDAASIPIAGLAALQALRDCGQAKTGSSILFHGASGGMGLFSIQIAKLFGARMTAVAGTNGVERMHELGADQVIDYKTRDGTRFDHPFDIIVNGSGKFPYAAGQRFLVSNGRLIEASPTIPGFIGSKIANIFRSRQHLMLMTQARRVDLVELVRLVDRRLLQTTIAKHYRFSDTPVAFMEQEKGGIVGKAVIQISH